MRLPSTSFSIKVTPLYCELLDLGPLLLFFAACTIGFICCTSTISPLPRNNSSHVAPLDSPEKEPESPTQFESDSVSPKVHHYLPLSIYQRNVVTESQSCPLCDAILEDTSHLFFNCSLARDVTRLLCRWWNLEVQSFSSYAEWLVWFNSVRLASNLKVILEGVFYVTWWSLWNFQNQLLFASKKPRKESIFDDIVLRSFCWCKARGSSKLRWDSWIQHPYLISL
ncbi:hypothetical protein Tco_0960612 [Tanacetum coccineum]